MLWRKRVHADTIEALHSEAEKTFAPGTRYAVFVIRDETFSGVRVSYRAEVHDGGSNTVPARTVHLESGSGAVRATNPDTISEIPTWKPQTIPADVLQDAPQVATVAALLIGNAIVPEPATSTATPAEDQELNGLLQKAATAGRGAPTTRLVIAGLLDDPVFAAESLGHRHWSAAGALNGGQPGAEVLCYGLGYGTAIRALAEGLSGMTGHGGSRLLLAVDPSRKHADTHRWITELSAIAHPEGLVTVDRIQTSTPETVRSLGLPILGHTGP